MPGEAQIISVDGSNLSIGTQLYEALAPLRCPHFERVLWVDAMCIDQKNKGEKAQQIRLMPRIYQQAKSVIVWLGEETDDSNEALRAICRVGHTRDAGLLNETATRQAIVNLIHRSWFRRIWVNQPILRVAKIEYNAEKWL
jgi:hypothetical protein